MSFKKMALSAAVLSTMFTVPAFAQSNSDSVLADNVRQAIEARPALATSQIHVRANGGTVYLYGSVDSTAESAMAETVAHKVDGVRQVVNSTSASSGAN